MTSLMETNRVTSATWQLATAVDASDRWLLFPTCCWTLSRGRHRLSSQHSRCDAPLCFPSDRLPRCWRSTCDRGTAPPGWLAPGESACWRRRRLGSWRPSWWRPACCWHGCNRIESHRRHGRRRRARSRRSGWVALEPGRHWTRWRRW